MEAPGPQRLRQLLPTQLCREPGGRSVIDNRLPGRPAREAQCEGGALGASAVDPGAVGGLGVEGTWAEGRAGRGQVGAQGDRPGLGDTGASRRGHVGWERLKLALDAGQAGERAGEDGRMGLPWSWEG